MRISDGSSDVCSSDLLPPGDYLSNQLAELRAQGEASALDRIEFLRHQYALDRPVIEQYAIWMGFWPGPNGLSGLLQGDWGWSFEYNRPVGQQIGRASCRERVGQ